MLDALSHVHAYTPVLCAGEASKVVLMGDRLSQLVEALVLGQATLAKIRVNLAWALMYNAVCIPLAAGGGRGLCGAYVGQGGAVWGTGG